jgi:hypothetical protein
VVADHPDAKKLGDALTAYGANTAAAKGAKLVHAWVVYGKGASSFCTDRPVLRIALPGGVERVVEWKPQADAPAVHQAFVERRNPATRDPFLGLTSLRGVGHVAQRWLVEDQKLKSKDLHGAHGDDAARLLAVRLADVHRRFTPGVVERVRGQPARSIADALADLVAAYFPLLVAEWRAFVAASDADLLREVSA